MPLYHITESAARRHDIIRGVAVAMPALIFPTPATAQFKRVEKLKPKKRVRWVLTAMSPAAAGTDIQDTIRSENDGVIWESDPSIRPFNHLPEPAYATLGMTAADRLDLVCPNDAVIAARLDSEKLVGFPGSTDRFERLGGEQ